MLDRTEFFECSCNNDEHTLRLVLDREENEIYASVFLNQYRSWYKKIWVGIRYIFGYKCKYGHWDVWTLKPEDAERLKSMLNELDKVNKI